MRALSIISPPPRSSSNNDPTTSYRRQYYYDEDMKMRQQRGGGRSCFCRILDCASSICYLGLLAVIAWVMFGRPSRQEAMDAINHAINNWDVSDFSNVLDNLTDAVWDNGFNEDPFEGMMGNYGGGDGEVSDNSTMIWKSATKDGLSLTLLNALDSSWQTEFAEAVSDWSESNVLDLTTKTVDVDNSCERVDGVMKVCNGNYGNTGWLGINEVQMEYYSKNDPGKIVSSVAKMNEYYLNHAEYTKRQYTMCHEIGHGFGLPHTDENFYNADQGNCLDYTNRPENNMHPGQVNMERLGYMYGNGDDDTVYYDDDYYNDNDDNKNNNKNNKNNDNKNNNDNGKQRRHTRARRRVIVRRFLPVPPSLLLSSHNDDNDN